MSEALENTEAIIIMTGWEEYKYIDWLNNGIKEFKNRSGK